MSLTFQPVCVGVGEDAEGQLALKDGTLVAVLVRLSRLHGDDAGRWFLESGFGGVATPNPPLFDTLADAAQWIEAKLAG